MTNYILQNCPNANTCEVAGTCYRAIANPDVGTFETEVKHLKSDGNGNFRLLGCPDHLEREQYINWNNTLIACDKAVSKLNQ